MSKIKYELKKKATKKLSYSTTVKKFSFILYSI